MWVGDTPLPVAQILDGLHRVSKELHTRWEDEVRCTCGVCAAEAGGAGCCMGLVAAWGWCSPCDRVQIKPGLPAENQLTGTWWAYQRPGPGLRPHPPSPAVTVRVSRDRFPAW